MKPMVRRLLVFAVVTLALAGCHGGKMDLVDSPRRFAGVALQDVTFYSPALNQNAKYRVYLPENVSGAAKLPVVYVLHGGGGDFTDWSNHSDVGKYAARGLIVVMPEGAFSYWVNAQLASADRYGDFLIRDLPADVEKRFPAAGDRNHRAIVGSSMGGFGAVVYALKRPDLFAFAGAMSPAIEVTSRGFSWMRFGQSERFRKIFGPKGSDARRASDPFVLVKTAEPARTPYLYLTAGEDEGLRKPIEGFVEQLKRRGFAYEYHTKPGGHGWDEWNMQLPGCFESLLSRIH
jgi:S-formylglutathione hydrolase FrmB